MLRSNKGEEGTGTVLTTIQGLILGIGGVAFFVVVGLTLFAMFGGKDDCEDSIGNLNLLYNKINDIYSNGKPEEAFFTINPGCVLIGLNKYGNNLAEGPSYCFERSCLCLCSISKNKDNPYDCRGEVCSIFEDLETIKGDYKIDNLNDTFFLYVTNARIFQGPSKATRYILNISKIDKGVYIEVLESKIVNENE